MNKSNVPAEENSSLEHLIHRALVEIERLGYSRRSRNRYKTVWGRLLDFSQKHQPDNQFSWELAVRFMEEHRFVSGQMVAPADGWRRHVVWSVKALLDFAENGCITRGVEVEAIRLTAAMQHVLRDYRKYCIERLQLQASTVNLRTREITIFLDYMHSQKRRTLAEIQAADLSDFVSWRDHFQSATVARIVSDIRCFLRFLMMRGLLHKDLSVELPQIRVFRDAKIPSVWPHELVTKLLDAVDRSSAKGKRDYAILLLASRLGLRSGDIRTLKLDHLHWEDSTIEIVQAKTGMPLRLPMTNEVGDALVDYLKSGRPQVAHREVFLKVRHPFDPFPDNHLHHIVNYWRLLAGIEFRTPQKHGIHSLRHTLATRLLQKETPFTTIAEVLGHASLESTRIYAKADVEALRTVALDTEEVNDVE